MLTTGTKPSHPFKPSLVNRAGRREKGAWHAEKVWRGRRQNQKIPAPASLNHTFAAHFATLICRQAHAVAAFIRRTAAFEARIETEKGLPDTGFSSANPKNREFPTMLKNMMDGLKSLLAAALVFITLTSAGCAWIQAGERRDETITVRDGQDEAETAPQDPAEADAPVPSIDQLP